MPRVRTAQTYGGMYSKIRRLCSLIIEFWCVIDISSHLPPNVLLLTRPHPGYLDVPRNCVAICPDVKTIPTGDAPACDSSCCCCNVCCREHASFAWHIHPHLPRPGAPRSCTSSWQCCPTDRYDNRLDDASETRHGSQGMAEDVKTKTSGRSLNVSYFNARYPRRQLDYFT
jgi:hypothetical protein